tara:strand:- start:5916 stop:6779 length:864 start_codon:yes stop_codon:yes gene_type:complete
MTDLKSIVKTCHPIIFASQLYAEVLNSTSMSNHIIKIIESNHDDYCVVPYCYFHNTFMDCEENIGTIFNDEIKNVLYNNQDMQLNSTKDIKKYIVPIFRKNIPTTNKQYLCGMIGVPIPNEDDPYAEQDHYIAYIYDKNNKILNYFDSAINNSYKQTESYKILVHTLNPRVIVVNKSTFETQGGISDSEYNYIAQNIFCHTWCLWFIYQFIVKKKSMLQIDQMTSKNKDKDYDKKNLIKIKKFVYETLLDKLELKNVYKLKLFKNAFRYIIIDDDQTNILEIIKKRD